MTPPAATSVAAAVTTSAATSVTTPERGRLRARLAPSSADLVDAGFVATLSLVGLLGFWTTFDSGRYLLVGAVGLVAGLLVAYVASRLEWPWLTVVALSIVAFYLFGAPVAVPDSTLAGVLPTGASLTQMSDIGVTGWKALLTTLPPVDGSGPFLVLPYLIGLISGAAAMTVARRTTGSLTVLLVPATSVIAVILFGTLQPAAMLAEGLGVAAVGFLWMVIRYRRHTDLAGTGTATRTHLLTGTVMILISLTVATLVGNYTTAAHQRSRIVLRAYVEPPFDVAAYPSPLVGFHKYAEGAEQLWDTTLLRVAGVPANTLLRLAVMDSYNGIVFSAAPASGEPTTEGSFRRTGTTIPLTASGDGVTATVTIAAGYADSPDLSAWIPGVGRPSKVAFTGPRAGSLQSALRVNVSTGQALVPDRLREGDTLTVTGIPFARAASSNSDAADADVSGDAADVSQDVSTGVLQSDFLQASVTRWVGGTEGDAMDQVRAVAATLRKKGYYSDGTRPAEFRYLPGHSQKRLTDFGGGDLQLVGNAEQYAAVMALAAHQLRVPARVVLGAPVPADGVVKGRHVTAWVELRDPTAGWVVLPTSEFMPDRSKKPETSPARQQSDPMSKIVPPPDAVRPPGSITSLVDADPGTDGVPPTSDAFVVPDWVFTVAKVVGIPLLMIALALGSIVVAKAVRRRRRRTRGSPSTRLANGWAEIVDHARDLGYRVAPDGTRREQSRQLSVLRLDDTALEADVAVFGPGDPSQAAIDDYWRRINVIRRGLSAPDGRRHRGRVRISLRSFRRAMPRDTSRSAAPAGLAPLPTVVSLGGPLATTVARRRT